MLFLPSVVNMIANPYPYRGGAYARGDQASYRENHRLEGRQGRHLSYFDVDTDLKRSVGWEMEIA